MTKKYSYGAGWSRKNLARFEDSKMIEIVPISEPGQNSRYLKYIGTSITKGNLHHSLESVTRKFQVGVLSLPGKIPFRPNLPVAPSLLPNITLEANDT